MGETLDSFIGRTVAALNRHGERLIVVERRLEALEAATEHAAREPAHAAGDDAPRIPDQFTAHALQADASSRDRLLHHQWGGTREYREEHQPDAPPHAHFTPAAQADRYGIKPPQPRAARAGTAGATVRARGDGTYAIAIPGCLNFADCDTLFRAETVRDALNRDHAALAIVRRLAAWADGKAGGDSWPTILVAARALAADVGDGR